MAKIHLGYSDIQRGSEIVQCSAPEEDLVILALNVCFSQPPMLAPRLTGATGCSVEIAASRAFIAGTKTARALCQEYICWALWLQFIAPIRFRIDSS